MFILRYKVVVIVAVVVALCSVIFAFIFSMFNFVGYFGAILFFVLFFITIFLIIAYFLNKDIYKRINKLYRLMYISGKEENVITIKSLNHLEEQVEKWILEKKPLLQHFKEQEKYRREFIGDVAHELKTPIFNIQGYILTLLDGGFKDKRINVKYLKKAKKNIERMISIVQDLDLITKLEYGRLVLDNKKFNLTKTILDAVEEMEIRALDKNIDLEFNYYGKDIWAFASREHIMQILVNLIENSIKYGKKNGQTLINIKQNKSSTRYIVQVDDDGIGIAKKDLPRIFERFYRVDKSRSRKEGGSGLGLSIVKHILEVQGETISVKSTLNKGTSFMFTLKKADS